MKKLITLVAVFLFIQPLFGCTIFILTDATTALFFNNEDYTNPNTRIWFVPAGNDYYGCVYVGYDDGSAQGGLNTEGLAFDWYAGQPVFYQPEEQLIPIDDNSSERMLEQCATVDEAINFYQTYAEPGFAKATLIIADKSGESVIIGARNGKIYFERSKKSNVLGGAGKAIFERLFNEKTPINLTSGSRILKQCVATGQGGTLYSNAYNLNSGDIYVYDFSEQVKYITLNLHEELEKGGHYYNIPQIKTEVKEPVKPLLLNMTRLVLFEFQPLVDKEPKISSLIRKIFTDGANGNLKGEYFSEGFWDELKATREALKSELQGLGKIESIHLIQKETEGELAVYSYVLIFENARLLQQFKLNKDKKVDELQTLSAFATNTLLPAGVSKGSGLMKNITGYSMLAFLIIIAGIFTFITIRKNNINMLSTSKDKMNIRKPKREDVNEIVKLLADDPLGMLREDFKDPLPDKYFTAFKNIINDPNQELIVVENENKEIIGTLQLSFIQYLTYQGGIRAQIEGVRIREDQRGKGIGEKMFLWAIETSKKRGAHLLQLTTDKKRPDALRFYEKLGFKATHEGMKLHFSN